MSNRKFKIKPELMQGEDIKEWQKLLLEIGKSWGIEFPLKADGVYGLGTRSISKMVLYGRGYNHSHLRNGITPELRIQARNPIRRPQSVRDMANTPERKQFRDDLRVKFAKGSDVAAPISKIIVMTWGWHPGVHDGVDLICGPNAPIFAVCDAKVVDVRAGGWWGKAPSGDITKGDGIIQIEALKTVGPIRKGMHFGYGHAEGADVKVGDVVKEGDKLGEAGLAVAWHVHFMANHGGTLRGIGEFDPRPILEYAIKNANKPKPRPKRKPAAKKPAATKTAPKAS